jgi:hypothetical protein
MGGKNDPACSLRAACLGRFSSHFLSLSLFPRYMNTAACRSSISYIDGEKGA